MKKKTLKVKSVKPYGDNPRNNEMAIDAVARSIEKYGYNQPIVVDSKNVIIVGHTRLEAIKRLGWESVEVLQADLSEDDARRHRIADNKTGEMANWNPAYLAAELREVEDVKEFFDESEINSLLQPFEPNEKHRVTQEQIDEYREKMDNHQKNLSEKKEQRLVEYECEHCGEKFSVDPQNVRASAAQDKISHPEEG